MAIKPIITDETTLAMTRAFELFPNAENTAYTAGGQVVTKDELDAIITDMLDTVKSHGAVGIAAIQIGEPIRVIVVKLKASYMVLINPVILSESKTRITNLEGCLSFKGRTIYNERPKETKVRYIDRDGKSRVKIFRDFESVIFQHEYDHLFGLTMMHQHSFTSYEDFAKFRDLAGTEYGGRIEYEIEYDPAYEKEAIAYKDRHRFLGMRSNKLVDNILMIKLDLVMAPWMRIKNWEAKQGMPVSL